MNSGWHISQYIGFVCSQFTNSLLLFLIYKKARKLFGTYRHIMFAFTAYSMIYTWIELIALPLMHIHESMFILMVDSFLSQKELIGCYIICLYCASYALCIALLAAQFYYRYIVICKPQNLEKLNGWKLWLLLVPGVFFFFIWFALVFFGMGKSKEKEEFIREVIMEQYGEDTKNMGFIALKFWDTDLTGRRHFRRFDALSYAGCCCIIAICFSTIMFCAFKIYFKLKCEKVSMSDKTKGLHKQLLKTLSVQTVLPFLMMYSTVGIILSLPIFEIEVGRKGNIVGSLAGVYPALEPLVAMYFVKDFRRALTCKTRVESEINHIKMENSRSKTRKSATALSMSQI